MLFRLLVLIPRFYGRFE